MKKILLTLVIITSLMNVSNAQVSINTNGNAPASSAMLDVSNTTKGVLLPRMTSAQRKAIATPDMGLLVYDTDRQTIYLYDGAQWKPMMVTTDNGLTLVSRKGVGATRNSGFGSSVDIRGDYAIVGSPNDSALGTNCGAAYIFTKQSGVWKQQAKIYPSNGTAYEKFGASVSIYGDIVVIGAPEKEISGDVHVGRVYYFYEIIKLDGFRTCY